MSGFIYFWRRYRLEAELAAMSWKIRWEDLDGDELKKIRRKVDEYDVCMVLILNLKHYFDLIVVHQMAAK
ncbi:hypothetical protein WUBG_17242, partial [Wuchereria bancrofti]